jgi:LuxR family maltose regulon positive regulatory protein
MVAPLPVVPSTRTNNRHHADAAKDWPQESQATNLIHSKLGLPLVSDDFLTRPRLLDLLQRDRRVALIAAPAGFGKTTLLAQWASEQDLPVAWVTLDGHDSDPVRFWTHVCYALQQAAPDSFGPESDDFPPTSVNDVVDMIINRMWAADTGAALVLDDYHEHRSDEVDQGVQRLIAGLPAGVRVVISTRHDPNLALARLRAAEQLVELRQRDLRFTEDEATRWFARRFVETTSDTVTEALAVTEGWPAAFALLFASNRHRTGRPGQPDHPHLAEYIREEVTRDHDDDWPILVVSSFCPHVSGPLLEHTLQISNGRDKLRRLAQSNLPLEQFDAGATDFRLHRLVADHVLLGHASDPEVRRWMVRAADWFTANNDARSALDLLIRAEEHDAAGTMISQSWLRYFRSGEIASLHSDLARIAPEVAKRHAPILVAQAWLHAHRGRRGDAIRNLRRAEPEADPGPLPDGCPSIEVARETINALYALDGLASTEASSRRVDALVDEESPWRPVADLAIGYASFLNGSLQAAQWAFDRVLASGDIFLRSIAIGWSTVIDVMEGWTEAARARFDVEAEQWHANRQLAESAPVVVAGAALAWAEGQPIEAAAALEACHSRLGRSDPTDRLEVLIWLAAADARIGRSERARGWLDAAGRIVTMLGGSEWHSSRLHEIEQRIGSRTERSGRDPGLTDREARILRLLSATHLSQREIGCELGVSFNTVKSHVKAIYVKLGATSREEASQIARNNGLI